MIAVQLMRPWRREPHRNSGHRSSDQRPGLLRPEVVISCLILSPFSEKKRKESMSGRQRVDLSCNTAAVQDDHLGAF